jgi:hypothetical protein
MHDTYDKTKKEKLKFKFNGFEKIEINYSQAYQDMFVLTMLNGKNNGTFVEIGTFHPTEISNTYLLEKQFGWRGISIDINNIPEYCNMRESKLIVEDALKLDYVKLFKDCGLPEHIDYLQLDIEPPENTLACLKMIPFNEYKFSVITFETDAYYANNSIIQESRKILEDNGYELVVKDVCNASLEWPFEDWYVNKNFIDSSILDMFKSNLKNTAENILLNKSDE